MTRFEFFVGFLFDTWKWILRSLQAARIVQLENLCTQQKVTGDKTLGYLEDGLPVLSSDDYPHL